MQNDRKKVKISFNAPVVLTFSIICLGELILDYFTGGWLGRTFFSVYRSSMASIFTYIRLIGHVFGHAGWEHLIGNIMLILVVGPLLEEKYGSVSIAAVIFLTALVTGAFNMIFFPQTVLMGASGVVFAFIILSSITSIKSGSIPITFIIVAVMYISEQVYQGVFVQDNVANFAHIIGGFLGAVFGYALNKDKLSR